MVALRNRAAEAGVGRAPGFQAVLGTTLSAFTHTEPPGPSFRGVPVSPDGVIISHVFGSGSSPSPFKKVGGGAEDSTLGSPGF